MIKNPELTLAKAQPVKACRADITRTKPTVHVLWLFTCLMRFSLWQTWKARCAMNLARLILQHQTPKWRIAGKRLDGGLRIFFEKWGLTHQTRLLWKAALLFLQPANWKWKTPRETWRWRNVRKKPANWALTTEEASPYKDDCSFPNMDMFFHCAGSVQ